MAQALILRARPVSADIYTAANSAHKFIGGSVRFTSDTPSTVKDITIKSETIYVDTTRVDISAFGPTQSDGSRNIFKLVATTFDTSNVTLWTSDPVYATQGVTLPKTVYTLPQRCGVIELTCTTQYSGYHSINNHNTSNTSNTSMAGCDDDGMMITTQTPTYYFMVWDLNSTIAVSPYVTPRIRATRTRVNYAYANEDVPCTILPGSQNLASISTSLTMTGDVTWNIVDAATGENVPGLQTEPYLDGISSGVSIQSNIYFQGSVYMTATTPDGLTGKSEEITLCVASIPKIVAPPTFYHTIHESYLSQPPWYQPFAQLTSLGTGPVTWTIQPIDAGDTDASNVIILPNGDISFVDNDIPRYVDATYRVSASNVLGSIGFALNLSHIIFASDPILKCPSQLYTYVSYIPTDTVAYAGFLQTSSATGPLEWTIRRNSRFHDGLGEGSGGESLPGMGIDETGVLSIAGNTYVQSYIDVSARNVFDVVDTNTVYVDSIPQPYFETPANNALRISVDATDPTNSTNSGDYTYIFERASYTDIPTTWTLASVSANMTGLVSMRNVFADNSYRGHFVIRSNVVIDNETMTVKAKHSPDRGWHGRNTAYSEYAATLTLSYAYTPILVNPGAVRATMSNNDVIITVPQLEQHTGTVEWTYEVASSTLDLYPEELYIDEPATTNAALSLRNMYNHNIDTTITVSATNVSGGQRSVTFPLVISQIPIIQPATIVYNISIGEVVTHQMATYTRDPNVVWYLGQNTAAAYGSAVALDSATGLVTVIVGPNQPVYANGTICASNVYGESSNVNVFISVQPVPDFVCPPIIYGTINNNQFNYQFQLTDTQMTITSWSLSVANLPTNIFLTMNSIGALTYTDNTGLNSQDFFERDIVVSASNLNGYAERKNTTVSLLAKPQIVTVPSADVTYLMTSNHPYFEYQMALGQNYGDLASVLEWSFTPQPPPPPGVSINQSTGLLTFAGYTYYDRMFNVKVSTGVYGSTATTPVHAFVAQAPYVKTFVKVSTEPNTQFSGVLEHNTYGTSPLIVSFTVPQSITSVLNIRDDFTLTIAPNTYINTVALGTPIQVSFTSDIIPQLTTQFNIELIAATTPHFTLPDSISHVLQPSNPVFTEQFIYTISQPSDDGVGPLTWSISSSNEKISLVEYTSTVALIFNSSNSSEYLYNEPVTITATNEADGYYMFETRITVIRDFVFGESFVYISQNFDLTEELYVSRQILYNDNDAVGPLTWSLKQFYYDYVNNTSLLKPNPHVNITNTGFITVNSGVTDYMFLEVNNMNNVTKSMYVYIYLTQTPNITSYIVLSESDLPYNLTQLVLNSEYAGPLWWNMTNDPPIDNVIIDYVLINNVYTQFLKYTGDTLYGVDTTIEIRAYNRNGVYADTQIRLYIPSQLVNVDFDPNIPSTLLFKNFGVDQSIDFSEQIPYNNNDAVGQLTWSLVDVITNEPIYGVNITSTGFITVKDVAVATQVDIIVTNGLGRTISMRIDMVITQTPIVNLDVQIIPGQVSEGDLPYDLNQIVMNSAYAGPLTWAITNDPPLNNVYVSVSDEGVLTYTGDTTNGVDITVGVRVTNRNSAYADTQIRVYIP